MLLLLVSHPRTPQLVPAFFLLESVPLLMFFLVRKQLTWNVFALRSVHFYECLFRLETPFSAPSAPASEASFLSLFAFFALMTIIVLLFIFSGNTIFESLFPRGLSMLCRVTFSVSFVGRWRAEVYEFQPRTDGERKRKRLSSKSIGRVTWGGIKTSGDFTK